MTELLSKPELKEVDINQCKIKSEEELHMATSRSFAEYVKDKCYNGLYRTAEE